MATKSAYLLTFNAFENTARCFLASKVGSSSENYFIKFCLLVVFYFVLFVITLLLVQTQNDCYKVSSTTSWLTYCC